MSAVFDFLVNTAGGGATRFSEVRQKTSDR